MRDPASDGDLRWRAGLSALLVAVAAGGAADLWLDRAQGPGLAHVAFETSLLVLSVAALAAIWVAWARDRRALSTIRARSAQHQQERDAWRARAEKLLSGLGEAIDEQLGAWSLTGAEREVALLLLKGFGHKEIAALQGRSERTVRQHAVAVYRKSGLAGRAELAGFFLEDLLLPAPDPDSGTNDGARRL